MAQETETRTQAEIEKARSQARRAQAEAIVRGWVRDFQKKRATRSGQAITAQTRRNY